MTNHDDADIRDPLRAAFADHRRPPRDVVPHTRDAGQTADVLAALAGRTVEVAHYELTGQGITKHIERVEICAPIIENTGDTTL